jgi:anti-sigma factor RsiW
MRANGLERQSDLEELSAWMDGELGPADAERVAGRVRTDPAWRATHEQFLALDRALDAMPAPRPRRSLTDGIVRAAHRRGLAVRIIRIAAPLAAAAAIVLALLIVRSLETGPRLPRLGAFEQEIARHLGSVAPEDRLIVVNLPMFERYPEVDAYEQVRDVADAETMAALTNLEAAGES